MYDFCPYCGKQLANGESCPTCRPREYSTYTAPQENNSYSDSDHNNHYNSNYRPYNNHYEEELRRYDEKYKAKNDKKNVIVLSAISLVMCGESLFTFWAGSFSLITGIIGIILASIATKKNKKLDKPLTIAKVALIISIIALVVGIISTVVFFLLFFGDGLYFFN